MVEGLIRDRLRQRGIEGLEVESAGVSAFDETLATPESVQALAELGVDISGHLARRARRQMMESADLVLCLASEHRDVVSWLAPDAFPRAFTMKELVLLLDQAQAADGGWETSDDPERRLIDAVERADRLRRTDPPVLADEDVADPLGLSIESYRATAWEVETLTDRIMDQVFGPVEEPGATEELWEEESERTAKGGER